MPTAAAHGLGRTQLGELVQFVVSALAEADTLPPPDPNSVALLRQREARFALDAVARWLEKMPDQHDPFIINILLDASQRTPTGGVSRDYRPSPPPVDKAGT